MYSIRDLRWLADRERLRTLDTSFTTDRVYRVIVTDCSFALEEQPISPVLRKTYDLADELEALPQCDHVAIAEEDGQIVGMAALKFESWNRRAVLYHLYVSPIYRQQGIGRALMNTLLQTARRMLARCLWVETQNVNYPAIQWYRQLGFQLCGLDTTLYDREGTVAGEVALFLSRTL